MSDKELKQPTKQDVLDYIKKGLQKKEDTLNVSIELDEKEEKDISKDVEEAKAMFGESLDKILELDEGLSDASDATEPETSGYNSNYANY